jgi:hypothetical protein
MPDLLVGVAPLRIGCFDQLQLPGAAPSLDALLLVDGVADVCVFLILDEPLDAIARREAGCQALAVFPDAPDAVGRDADLKCAAWLRGEDVDP